MAQIADLHEEILYFIPSTELLNFKRVCKDWNELISSQKFIHNHRSKRTLIVTLSLSGILCADATGKEFRRSIPYPQGFSYDNTIIAGSCDGLVCLVRTNYSKYLVIINPSTGKSVVHRSDGFVFYFDRDDCFWFGHHPCTGEYLIISISMGQFSDKIQVCEFSNTPPSFQEFSFPQTMHFSKPIPILLHGALHWPGYRPMSNNDVGAVVFSYDIEKKKLAENFPTFETAFRDVRLGMVNECLFAMVRKWEHWRSELWMMEEYGVEESWTKYCDAEVGLGKRCDLSPMGFLPDGDLVLNVGNKEIVKYSFRDRKGTVVPDIEARRAVLCADSLVSPSLIWGNSLNA